MSFENKKKLRTNQENILNLYDPKIKLHNNGYNNRFVMPLLFIAIIIILWLSGRRETVNCASIAVLTMGQAKKVE